MLQHCHQEPPAIKAAVRGDPRTQRLASRLVASAGNWTGRIVGNVAWAYAVLQHGPPTIMDIVRTDDKVSALAGSRLCSLMQSDGLIISGWHAL